MHEEIFIQQDLVHFFLAEGLRAIMPIKSNRRKDSHKTNQSEAKGIWVAAFYEILYITVLNLFHSSVFSRKKNSIPFLISDSLYLVKMAELWFLLMRQEFFVTEKSILVQLSV